MECSCFFCSESGKKFGMKSFEHFSVFSAFSPVFPVCDFVCFEVSYVVEFVLPVIMTGLFNKKGDSPGLRTRQFFALPWIGGCHCRFILFHYFFKED